MYEAIRNSLVQKKNINQGIELIEEMPVFHPTEEEFKDPLVYIEKVYLEEGGREAGCIKIVPPASFKPPFAFNTRSEKRLHTRKQVLQKLSQGLPFTHNKEGYTFKEFEAMATQNEAGDANIDWADDDEVYRNIEKSYWDLVENQIGEDI